MFKLNYLHEITINLQAYKQNSLKLIENNNKDKKIAKPFVKWAGGKGQLLTELQKMYPMNFEKNIIKYAEPFVGGGAVLFDILSNYNISEVYISDINSELINAYKVIRDKCDELVDRLEIFKAEYVSTSFKQKEYYYDKREKYNESMQKTEKNIIDVEKAALFIFLNKTCFNGLYRVNRKGQFNVPIGSYKNPSICDKENLYKISKLLKNVTIVCGDYKLSEKFIDKNTFVYFDPPYRPLNKTANFTSYNAEEFSDDKQIELAKFIKISAKKGAKIIASNSDPKNINKDDNFFDELYTEFNITRINAKRMINSNASKRGKINELVITSF